MPRGDSDRSVICAEWDGKRDCADVDVKIGVKVATKEEEEEDEWPANECCEQIQTHHGDPSWLPAVPLILPEG